jgi:hypothetical protein
MPTRVFYNTSPYGFQHQPPPPQPQIQPPQPQPQMTYFNTNHMYDHMIPTQIQHPHVHAYIPYPNHLYSHQNQQNVYRDPSSHAYPFVHISNNNNNNNNNNATNQTTYYHDQYQQPNNNTQMAFQNNGAFYQNPLHAYHQMALLQAQYYNLNYANQYYKNTTNTAYTNVSPVPPASNATAGKIEILKPNKEIVYHKIPEFKTVRKRLPTESTRRSHREKTSKAGLERNQRSQSAMASIGVASPEKTKTVEKKNANLTKINELKEIKKKMEKLEEISAKDSDERKKQKLDILRKLRNRKNYENFNIYINELPFTEEEKKQKNTINAVTTSKGEHSDESGLGDIDIKSKNSSSSKFSQSESSDSSAHPEPQTTITPAKKIIPIINHNSKPVMPQIKSLLPNEKHQERKQSKSRMNTDLLKPEMTTVPQEPSKLVIKQKFKFLGIFNANPEVNAWILK